MVPLMQVFYCHIINRITEENVMSRNILIVISDQHSAKVLGHEGHPDVKTPHMDRLAAEGTRFGNCTTANPICTPSRMSFLSGQYPHNHGYFGLSGPNPEGLPSVLGHFRRHGYATAAIGKIHCPEYWVEDDADVFHETCECSRDGRSAEYTRFLEETGNRDDHLSYPPELGVKPKPPTDGHPSTCSFEASQEGWIAQKTIDFIDDSAEAGKPWIAWASLPRPHQIASPCQEFWDLYETDNLTLPPTCDQEPKLRAPHFMYRRKRWLESAWPLFEPKDFASARLRKHHAYLGAISQCDAALGKLLNHLDAKSIADDTVVIYTSDHGEYACEWDMMEKAPGTCSDAVCRIPFIWRGPGIQSGALSSVQVESVDLPATVCAQAGLPPMATSDGDSLVGPLAGDNAAWTKQIGVTEHLWTKSVRRGDWRLVVYPKSMFPDEYPDGFGELYNVADDPWEIQNRWFDADQQERIRSMSMDLYDCIVTTSRPVTVNGAKLPPSSDVRTRYLRDILPDGKLSAPLLREGHYNRNYI